ncbi:MAG: hypothetical protein QOJ64_841 [Acidobacteriota bacterium]|jgi:hypothetical protein|nr:hypothetical protein [Acidobacteriota bacterium]
MLTRILQGTRSISYAVTLALLLQSGAMACALGCSSSAPIEDKAECHDSTSARRPAASEVSAATSEKACCHISGVDSREGDSTTSARVVHNAAAMMTSCMSATQLVTPLIRQRGTVDSAYDNIREKISNPHTLSFRKPPFDQTWVPDRGGTYLRWRVLLI